MDTVNFEPPSHTTSFRLAHLPPEIRQLIWEATLPERRFFHVSDCKKTFPTNPLHNGSGVWHAEPIEMTFDFYIRHAPPMAARICRESRAIALSHGFFLAAVKSRFNPSPGLWFNPRRDMLYFDRNVRHHIKIEPRIYVNGLEKIMNLGIEWRAWFRDIPRLREGETMCPHWQAALKPLLVYCPQIESVSFILPRVRHVGGVTFGREPYSAACYPCNLIPLPDNIRIPWEKLPPLGPGETLGIPGLALSLNGGTSTLTEWKTIRREIESCIELSTESVREGDQVSMDRECRTFGKPGRARPSVSGWWLIRLGAPTNYEQQDVREFLS